MDREFVEMVHDLTGRGEPFVVATVIRTEGSTSARTGAKAIIREDGSCALGWVGGGCAETAVAEEARAVLKDGKPRIIHLDLRDQVFGVGMPCGGSMEVYIEAVLPRPSLVVIGHGRIAETVASLGSLLGYSVVVSDRLATEEAFPTADRIISDDPDLDDLPVTDRSFVVITTQHKSDDLALRRAIEEGAWHIALVASRTRTGIVFDTLREQGVPEEKLQAVSAPAGLDLAAVTPEEIALSILGEIVAVRRGGTTRLLREVEPRDPS